jgi:hypothetical protein
MLDGDGKVGSGLNKAAMVYLHIPRGFGGGDKFLTTPRVDIGRFQSQ